MSSNNNIRFIDIICIYKTRIISIINTSPIMLDTMIGINDDKRNQLSSFITNYCTLVDKDNDMYRIPVLYLYQHRKLTRELDHYNVALEQLPVSYFMNLVAYYDHFFSSLLRCLFITKPDIMKTFDKQVKIGDIFDLNSVEEIRDYFIDKEIDSVLRKSHHDQIDYLEKISGTVLTKDLKIWPEFVEICERRNLLVHCDGIVNQQYRNICASNKCDISDVDLKEKLTVTCEYLNRACYVLLEMGVKLALVVWNKYGDNADDELADKANELVYDLIVDEHYHIAIEIALFILTVKAFHYKESCRLMLTMNLAQAYKWSDQEKEKNNILQKIDSKAMSDEYRICYYVLNDDYTSALKLMKDIAHSEKVKRCDYDNWPIFRELRKQPAYNETYKSIYGEYPNEGIHNEKINSKGMLGEYHSKDTNERVLGQSSDKL